MILICGDKEDVGHHFYRGDHLFFRAGNCLRSRMRTVEIGEGMHAGDAALLAICALLLGYLLYALLKAEEF
jgi:K+-transporting ATPase KdpF subunit